jgi:hypothetical protein
VDGQRVVIAEGSYGDGVSWLIWAGHDSPGDGESGADELVSMIRVTGLHGRILHECSCGGPAPYPGNLMNVSTGGGEEGPMP